MHRCPECGAYLKFKLTYNCGSPIVIWSCENCGFDTTKYRNTVSTNTKFEKTNVSFVSDKTEIK